MIKKKSIALFSLFLAVLALLLLNPHPVYAAPVTDFPVTVTQPDGTVLHVFASGDEYYNWLHDENGYTIIQDPVTGYYVYADLVEGKLIPTEFIVSQTDPASKGLQPFINISPEQREEIRQAFLDETQQMLGDSRDAPRSGTLTNLVVFIRFSDESEFTDATSKYIGMLNDSTSGANSLRNYYQEVSYNALTINSLLFPVPGDTIVSYQDRHPRGYYQPYNGVTNPVGYTAGERGLREHALVRDAINYVNGLGQFPNETMIDANGDGVVDSLTFVVSGSPGGWNELLWPHAWGLYSYTVTINGKTVNGYQFQLQTMINNGVLAHEMFHVLGAPDLYHYASTGNPVGNWDVMSYNRNPPQHMSCYMKYKYGGWISSIPELPFTIPATYELKPLTSPTENCKKIASPYSTTEFFVVEYRNKAGGSTFESSLPGTGLLVYRINTLAQGNGSGPPDEVYVYRAFDILDRATFSSNVGRTAINDGTNPRSLLSNGEPGGLNLCNIGTSAATIPFNICLASQFTISGNAGVSGATLSYIDGIPKTTTATGSGSYSLVVPAGWSGSVTASKPGFTFTPTSRSYSDVLFNRTAQDYSASGPQNLIQDSSFEAFVPGTAHPHWTGTSTNFGTPLCTSASCAPSGASKPQTGSAWGRFGYTTYAEAASLSQTITIPRGTALLEFYFWIGSASVGSDAADVFTVRIDGVPVFLANATQMASYSTYTFVSVDISAYADDAPHTIMFSSVTNNQFIVFNLDDVALFSLPAPPGAFDKIGPSDGAADQPTNLNLSWGVSGGATSYEYCYDTSSDNLCSNWTSNGSSETTVLSGLSTGTTYYWHMRAINSGGITYSNDDATAFWSFTTAMDSPGAFHRMSPASGAANLSSSPTLSWAPSPGATAYEFCYDITDDNVCSNWISNGTSTSKTLSGLSYSTTYYWQVRAVNSAGIRYAEYGQAAFWFFKTQGPPVQKTFTATVDDGWVLESTETSNKGGTMNATAATFNVGDDATDKQYRGILSFNTASLPDNAVITAVTFKFRKQSVIGTNPFSTHGKLIMDMNKGAFGSNRVLQLTDFQAVANKVKMVIPNAPSAGWYTRNLPAAALTYINKVGVTQIRLRFALDDNDDLGADYLKFFSGNAIAANRPQLIIQYHLR